MTIQYKVLGFEPTTFRTQVTSHYHQTWAHARFLLDKEDQVFFQEPETSFFPFTRLSLVRVREPNFRTNFFKFFSLLKLKGIRRSRRSRNVQSKHGFKRKCTSVHGQGGTTIKSFKRFQLYVCIYVTITVTLANFCNDWVYLLIGREMQFNCRVFKKDNQTVQNVYLVAYMIFYSLLHRHIP